MIQVLLNEPEFTTFTFKGALYMWRPKVSKLLRYFRSSNEWHQIELTCEAGHAFAKYLLANGITGI
jgi:hypothetical protein